MNCTNCKNPVSDNAEQCEWCNFALNTSKKSNSSSIILDKGECMFFSKRIESIYGFYEVHEEYIKIISRDEKLQLIIDRENIYNIEPYSRLKWLHFIIIIGTLVRYFILLFSKFERGYSIITSKSGNNFLIPKKNNLQTFDIIARSYNKGEQSKANEKTIHTPTGSGSFMDENNSFTHGGNTYLGKLLEKHSDLLSRNSVSDFEKKCPNCSIWIFHDCLGKYECPECEHEYILD
jgi:hypothetical protein